MKDDKLAKKQYNEMVKEVSPNTKIYSNCLKAFITGGLICIIGQIITNVTKQYISDTDTVALITSVLLILISVLLTGMGLYSKMGKFCGAGTIVPITGFANSVASPALEFKKEGFILGLGAKMFIVAGPVIVYGVLTSMAVGLVYFILK